MAHPSIRDQLVGYIINGFLIPVLGPALHKVSGASICCSFSEMSVRVINMRRTSGTKCVKVDGVTVCLSTLSSNDRVMYDKMIQI